MSSLRISIFVALMVGLVNLASAQQKLTHKKKMYVDEKGRFYMNKDLPVYLWLSTSPADNAPKHRLQSESAPQYSNPLYFDTEGYNTVRTPSKVDTVTKKVVLPLEDIVFEVYTDSEAPVTKRSFGKTPRYTKDGKLYVGKGLELTITTKDALSGVEQLLHSVDNAAFTKHTGMPSFAAEKEYSYNYYAVDNTGNDENLHTISFVTDYTAPVTTLKLENDFVENIVSIRTSFILDPTDASSGVSKVFYKLDDGPIKRYAAPFNLASRLGEGDHTLTYYSVDYVNNEETEHTFDFFLDITAPIVVEEVMGDQFFANGKAYSSGRTKLKLTAVDNKSGVEAIYYAINKGERQKYEVPFYYSSKAGSLQLNSYAVDRVGNKSAGGAGAGGAGSATYVDLTGPELSHSFSGQQMVIRDTTFINDKTKLLLKAIDTESGFKKIVYNLDKEPETGYASAFTVEKEGLHEVEYFGYDNVNNTNRNSFYFIVDKTGPAIYERFGNLSSGKKTIDGVTVDSYVRHVTLFLTATDDLVGFQKMYYSLNGGPEKLYNGLITNLKGGALIAVKVRALDKLGNQQEKEFKFFVE